MDKKGAKGKKEPEPKAPVDRRKILLVTGSNRGIGKGIIECLLKKKSKHRIILTARDDEKGNAAYNELCEKYPEEKERFFYHQLDITNEESIADLIGWIKGQFKKFDYLVNNAGVSSMGTDFNVEVFNKTFETNVNGTIVFTEKMLSSDVMNKSGKIIFIGSSSGRLSKLKETLAEDFKKAKTSDDLFRLAEKFKASIENNTVEQDGWVKNCYSVSQMIINTYARVISHRRDVAKEQIAVYVGNPGWVKTEMGGENAKLTIEEGVETPVYLIELPDGISKDNQGKYFDKCKPASFD